MPLLQTLFTERHDVAKQRLAICKECPYYETHIGRCQKCGCFLEYKSLVMSAECPIGKWTAEEK